MPCQCACRYADAGAYAGKFRALQQRALSAVRSRVSAVLRHASEQVRPGLDTPLNSLSGRLRDPLD